MKLEIVSPAEKRKGARRDAVVAFVARPEKKDPARFETVPGTGHAFPVEDPRGFVQRVLAFANAATPAS